MRQFLGMSLVALLLSPVQAQVLSVVPKLNTTIPNPLDITLVIDGEQTPLTNYDWDRIKVVVDGRDFSTTARTILAGPVAVALAPNQFILTQQEIQGNQLRVRLYGIQAPKGLRRVQLAIPGKPGTKSLSLEGFFIVS